jgi:hypothetical protein
MKKNILTPEAERKELLEIKERLMEIMIRIRENPPISDLNQNTLQECLKTIIEIETFLKESPPDRSSFLKPF